MFSSEAGLTTCLFGDVNNAGGVDLDDILSVLDAFGRLPLSCPDACP